MVPDPKQSIGMLRVRSGMWILDVPTSLQTIQNYPVAPSEHGRGAFFYRLSVVGPSVVVVRNGGLFGAVGQRFLLVVSGRQYQYQVSCSTHTVH